jgi:hypothetical protein
VVAGGAQREQSTEDVLVTAKLIGESDGHTVSRDFEHEGDAIRWLQNAGLVDLEDQTARGEIRMEGAEFATTDAPMRLVIWSQFVGNARQPAVPNMPVGLDLAN